MGFSKSNSKREVYNNTIIPQEIRKALKKQPNSTSKAVGEKRIKKPPKSAEGKKSQRSEQKYMKKK